MELYQTRIQKFLEERGWDNLRPGDLAKAISIEAAELLENFQWDNPTLEETKKDTKKMEAIKKEWADVQIYLLQMAVLLDFDSGKAIIEKLEKVEKKYPAHLMKARDGKEPGTESAYWQIKAAHRSENLESGQDIQGTEV